MFIIYVQGVVGLDSLVRLLWKCSEDFSNLLIKDPHFWVAVLNRSLLFCPSHMHTLLPLLSGHCSRICSGTGLMYLSPNKYMRPASEQILLECPLMSGSCVCVRGKTKVTG